jgi:DNA-directed RNA polymerase specialized sigma24 family protein
MSSVFPTDFLDTRSDRERVFFWIRPVDDAGFVVDKVFAEAAYTRAQQLRLYRWRELTDEAVRANLVERAVYAASRARAGNSIEDPKGYVFTAFARLVDRYIAGQPTLVDTSNLELEQLPQSVGYAKSSSVHNLDDEIFQNQILDAMPHQDRWAWERRIHGYEVQEIAATLNVSADCLSTRMRRCAREAARILRVGRARQ